MFVDFSCSLSSHVGVVNLHVNRNYRKNKMHCNYELDFQGFKILNETFETIATVKTR